MSLRARVDKQNNKRTNYQNKGALIFIDQYLGEWNSGVYVEGERIVIYIAIDAIYNKS